MAPERLPRWLTGFEGRHGVLRTITTPNVVRIEAGDGAFAECYVPFPPLSGSTAAGGATGHEMAHDGLATGSLVEHACRDRTVGVLLARLGGHAAGVFEGYRLVASKVGSRPVHGRNKAGGQSQKRFHRRREEQARAAVQAAGDVAARVLLPYEHSLHAVVLGGDRQAVDSLREDRRLTPLFALATERFLTVPDPRLAVLRRAPEQFRGVRIRVVEPPELAE